jgi:hypothetical protein
MLNVLDNRELKNIFAPKTHEAKATGEDSPPNIMSVLFVGSNTI